MVLNNLQYEMEVKVHNQVLDYCCRVLKHYLHSFHCETHYSHHLFQLTQTFLQTAQDPQFIQNYLCYLVHFTTAQDA